MAIEDLESIWDYTARFWDVDQSEKYLRTINHSFEELAEDPLRGKSCEDIRKGYCKFSIGKHLIFYRTTERVLEIVRILHEQMDLPNTSCRRRSAVKMFRKFADEILFR